MWDRGLIKSLKLKGWGKGTGFRFINGSIPSGLPRDYIKLGYNVTCMEPTKFLTSFLYIKFVIWEFKFIRLGRGISNRKTFKVRLWWCVASCSYINLSVLTFLAVTSYLSNFKKNIIKSLFLNKNTINILISLLMTLINSKKNTKFKRKIWINTIHTWPNTKSVTTWKLYYLLSK